MREIIEHLHIHQPHVVDNRGYAQGCPLLGSSEGSAKPSLHFAFVPFDQTMKADVFSPPAGQLQPRG